MTGNNFQNQTSFSAGEIAPDLYGGVDHDFYPIGLRTCRNFILQKYGGASNRPGSLLVSEAKDSSKKVRLIPFAFNELQTYALEFGNQTMRVVKNGGEVLETAFTRTITAITQATQGVVTSAAHGFSNGDDVDLFGIVGMIQLDGRTVRISDVTTNTFKMKDFQGNYINTTAYAAYVSGGTAARVYTVITPWLDTDLFNLNYAQNKDVITVVHPSYMIQDITRTAHDAWTVGPFNIQNGPFKDINITTTTIYASAVSGVGITLTASTSIFTANDVGTLFYLEQSPTDLTATWEVQKGVNQSEIRRAGFNYYQAPTSGAMAKTITAITAASPGVVTSAAHGLTNGQVIYLTAIVGMTQLNNTFFKVAAATANTFQLQTLGGNDVVTSSYTAYVSGGTATTAWATGTVEPDHLEGTQTDGTPGVPWTYLHSGFGIVSITAQAGTTATATVVSRLPDNVIGAGGATLNWSKAAFSITEGYPAAVAYHKQRLMFGGTTNNPNTIWMSGIGLRTNFGVSKPILDDDAITLPLDTDEVNAVRHLISLKALVALTSSSEQVIAGANGAIAATTPPNADVQGKTGANKMKPIIIGNTALYTEDTNDVVRSLQYQFATDSFTGIDLTARSPHLFRNRSIVDWAYQKRPFSCVWTIMSDGAMLGFTFMDEQKVYAWSRHDTDGLYESVCSIREGNETAVYQVVNRTVNGTSRRYTERHASRIYTSILDAFFVDCGLTYDGRNTSATTITVSGGTLWDNPEVLTLTASAAIFLNTDINNQITFTLGNEVFRLTINGYSSPTVVTAVPTRALPVAYQNVARTDWTFARLTFYNFNHLEGKPAAVLADGSVQYGLTVTNGMVTLPRPGGVVHIGLGYTSDLETLDISNPGGQLKAKSVNIPRVFVTAQESRGLYAATNGYNDDSSVKDTNFFVEVKPLARNPNDGYDTAIPLKTGVFEVLTNTSWSNKGRIGLRQTDPLPITINAITMEAPVGYP